MKKIQCLSANSIKIIAAISMLIDHIGCIFFPDIEILRIIGRISFPLFAFMIAQGCFYTRNKLKYFFMVFGLAIVCQIAYFVTAQGSLFGVLFTFSIAIVLIYSLQYLKYNFKTKTSKLKKGLSVTVFVSLMVLTVWINTVFEIDYGFWGCVLPVFASLFVEMKNERLKRLLTLIAFTLGIVLLSIDCGEHQWFALLALVPLLLYSGKRGKHNLKYFFYIFYPLHLVVLYGISLLFY